MGYISCWIDAHSWVSLYLRDGSSRLFNTIHCKKRSVNVTKLRSPQLAMCMW